MAQPRYDHSVAGLGEANFEKLRNCKVLVVGAGGIGTELMSSLRLIDYPQVSAILIVILGAVIVVDGLSNWLRVRLQ